MKRALKVLVALCLGIGLPGAVEAQTASTQVPGDPAAGRQVFEAYCAKCHSLDPKQAGKRGPHLSGLLQRRYAAVEGFPYRMVWPLADPVWTPGHLDGYLEIHRLAEPGLRADAIAFLVAATGGGAFEAGLGDPAAGESLFNAKCAYCHDLTRTAATPSSGDRRYEEITRALDRHPWEPPGAGPEAGIVTERVRRGPHLAGLLGRAPGAAEGFPYRFVYEIKGPTWSPPALDSYIEFHARLEPLERADLIAFLRKATK